MKSEMDGQRIASLKEQEENFERELRALRMENEGIASLCRKAQDELEVQYAACEAQTHQCWHPFHPT